MPERGQEPLIRDITCVTEFDFATVDHSRVAGIQALSRVCVRLHVVTEPLSQHRRKSQIAVLS